MQDRQEEQWGNDLNDDRWEGQADPNGRNTVQTPQPVNYGSQRRGSRGILLPAILAAVSVTCLVVVLALTGAFDWITDGGDTSSSDDPPVQQQSMSVVVTSDEEDEAEKEEEPAKQEEESSTKKEAEPAAEQAAPATTTTQEAARGLRYVLQARGRLNRDGGALLRRHDALGGRDRMGVGYGLVIAAIVDDGVNDFGRHLIWRVFHHMLLSRVYLQFRITHAMRRA